MKKELLAAGAMMLAQAVPAAADSDGHYCFGRGYIAWETRALDSGTGHYLHVVRFSVASGIVRIAPIRLEDFQVHAMTCSATTVELHGWSTRYSVNISDPARTTVRTREARADVSPPASNANLAHWGQPGVVILESDGEPGEFQLVIARTSRAIRGGIEHYTFTELVRRDPAAPRITDSLTLFRGVFLETIH